MPTGSYIDQPLRGYVAPGELDPVGYDLFRVALLWEIPFWEGADRPYMRSWPLSDVGGKWIRPTLVNPAASIVPEWNTQVSLGASSAPSRSGHIGIQLKAGRTTTGGRTGYRYDDILSSALSPFIVSQSFSFLLVGTPQQHNTVTGVLEATASNHARTFLTMLRPTGQIEHRMAANYLTGRFSWQEFAATRNTLTTSKNFYNQRTAFLFIHGPEKGVLRPMRMYVAHEDGEVERLDFDGGGGNPYRSVRDINLWVTNINTKEQNVGGGLWEYAAFFLRGFEDDEARALLNRDPLGGVKWSPNVIRKIGIPFGLPIPTKTCPVEGRDVPAVGALDRDVDTEDRIQPEPDESAIRAIDVVDHPSGGETDVEVRVVPDVGALDRDADVDGRVQPAPDESATRAADATEGESPRETEVTEGEAPRTTDVDPSDC